MALTEGTASGRSPRPIRTALSAGSSRVPGWPVWLGPLERELVPVTGVKIVGDPERAVLRVVVDVHHPHHRDPGTHLQQPRLLRRRHPGPDQLDAAGELVP